MSFDIEAATSDDPCTDADTCAGRVRMRRCPLNLGHVGSYPGRRAILLPWSSGGALCWYLGCRIWLAYLAHARKRTLSAFRAQLLRCTPSPLGPIPSSGEGLAGWLVCGADSAASERTPGTYPGAPHLTGSLLASPSCRPSRTPNAGSSRRAWWLGSLRAIGWSPLPPALARFAHGVSPRGVAYFASRRSPTTYRRNELQQPQSGGLARPACAGLVRVLR